MEATQKAQSRRTVRRWATWFVAVVACTVSASVARGEGIPRDEGFMKESKAVEHRIYSLRDKWDLGVFGTFSMKNQLTESYGMGLVVDRSLGEYFGIDLMLNGNLGGLTNLAKSLRDAPSTLVGKFDDLAGGGALIATGQIGIRFTPFYGKLSLSAEIPVHFHLYFVAGVGAAYVDYNSVLVCENDVAGGVCPDENFHHEGKVKPAFNVGGGLRFYITRLLSIRAEVRDIMFPDQQYSQVDLAKPASSSTNARGANGYVSGAGITHTPLVFLGVGFLL